MPKSTSVTLGSCFDVRPANLKLAQQLQRQQAAEATPRMKYIPHPERAAVPLIAGSLQGLGDVTPGAALVAMRQQLGVDGRPRIPVAKTNLATVPKQQAVPTNLNPWAQQVDPRTFGVLNGFGDAAADQVAASLPAFASGLTKQALMNTTLVQLKAFVSVTTRLVGAIPGFGDGVWETIKMAAANGVAQATKDAALSQLRALEARIKELEGRSAKVLDGSLPLATWINQATGLADDAAYHLKSTFDSTLMGQVPAILKDNIVNLSANLKMGAAELGAGAADVVYSGAAAALDKLKDKAKESPISALVIGGVVLGGLALFAVVKTSQAAGAVSQAAGTIRDLTGGGYARVKADAQAAYGAAKKRVGLQGLAGPGCSCGGTCKHCGGPGTVGPGNPFGLLGLDGCGCNTFELSGLPSSSKRRKKSRKARRR